MARRELGESFGGRHRACAGDLVGRASNQTEKKRRLFWLQRLLRFLLWMRADAAGGRKKGETEIEAEGGLSLGGLLFSRGMASDQRERPLRRSDLPSHRVQVHSRRG